MAEDTISSKQAREVFAHMVDSGDMPSKIIEDHGMKQVSDTGALEAFVEAVLAAYPDKVAKYRNGKTVLLGFFVGMVMKERDVLTPPLRLIPSWCEGSSETYSIKSNHALYTLELSLIGFRFKCKYI